MQLKINCDGGARGNPGPAAIGFIVVDSSNNVIHKHHEFIGNATNNVAEYRAVVAALTWLVAHPQDQASLIRFYLDSALVVNQLNGLFKVKQAHLRDLIVKIKLLESQISTPITYTSIPRSQNSLADSLVNQALDSVLL